jgi:predicted nucleic acid-binding protein
MLDRAVVNASRLVAARRRGLLVDLRATLLDLKRAGYYLSDSVIEGACKAAGAH